MIIKLIQIGTSKGIRLPKSIIDQFNFEDEIEAKIQKDGLLLKTNTKPRAGWKNQIREEVKKNGPAEILFPENLNSDVDMENWKW